MFDLGEEYLEAYATTLIFTQREAYPIVKHPGPGTSNNTNPVKDQSPSLLSGCALCIVTI